MAVSNRSLQSEIDELNVCFQEKQTFDVTAETSNILH